MVSFHGITLKDAGRESELIFRYNRESVDRIGQHEGCVTIARQRDGGSRGGANSDLHNGNRTSAGFQSPGKQP